MYNHSMTMKTDEELMELLDDLIARNKTDLRLDPKDKYRLRYLEWKSRKYAKGFNEDYKDIDVDKVMAMRHDQLMTDTEIGKTMGLDYKVINRLIKFFGIQVDEDRQAEFDQHKKKFMAESRKKPRKQTPEERAHRKETFRKLRESGKMSEIVKRRKATLQRKYGADNTMHIQSIKDKVAKTNMKKYGSRSPMGNKDVRKRAEKTLNERYGVEHSSFESKEIQDKARKTMYERYGGTGVAVPEIKEKVKKTNLRKYGVEWATQIPEAREKAKESYLRKYGFDNPSKADEVKKRINDTFMERYGCRYPEPEYRSEGPRVRKRISKLNLAIGHAIEQEFKGCKVSYEPKIGTIGNADIKVVLDDKQFILDINPTATHNTLIPFACLISGCSQPCHNPRHKTIKKDYHHKRAEEARRLGMVYGQFYQWNSMDTIRGWIHAQLGDFEDERVVSLEQVDDTEAERFIDGNGLNPIPSDHARLYGMQANTNRIAVCSITPLSNEDKTVVWILHRPYTLQYTKAMHETVLKQIRTDYPDYRIIEYVDYNYEDPIELQRIGHTQPMLVWARNDSPKAILNINDQSEQDNAMIEDGWLPVYVDEYEVYDSD